MNIARVSLIAISILFGVSQSALAATKAIKLKTLYPKAMTIDMMGFNSAKITLPAKEGMPDVITEKGFYADCILRGIRAVGTKVEIFVDFDADLEDGINACQVHINERSGHGVSIELLVEVIS